MSKPQDATTRNVKASNKRDQWLKLRQTELESRVKTLEVQLADGLKRIKKLERVKRFPDDRIDVDGQ